MNGSEWFRICMSLQDDIRVTCYLWLEWRTVEKKLKHFFFWVFFGEHSRFTGQQGKGEAISLTSLYHVHPLHRHLDISRAITADSSLVHIASSCTRTGKLWFPSTNRHPLNCTPLNIYYGVLMSSGITWLTIRKRFPNTNIIFVINRCGMNIKLCVQFCYFVNVILMLFQLFYHSSVRPAIYKTDGIIFQAMYRIVAET